MTWHEKTVLMYTKYTPSHYFTYLNFCKCYISCKNTFGVKKPWPSKVESYLEVNTYISRLTTTKFDIRIWPRLSILNTSTTLVVASYCLRSYIGPANLLSAISCYKFHISKDQQENMKFTIICHLAAFFVWDY